METILGTERCDSGNERACWQVAPLSAYNTVRGVDTVAHTAKSVTLKGKKASLVWLGIQDRGQSPASITQTCNDRRIDGGQRLNGMVYG